MKMRVEIERGPGDVRTLTVEGTETDIAHALAGLAVEWHPHIHTAEPDGVDPELRSMFEGDPQAVEVGLRISEELARRYGPDIIQRLDRRMDAAVEHAAEEFATAVVAGTKSEDDIVPFVMSRLRAEFLSEIPDFPEHLLDSALEVSGRMLQEYFSKAGPVVQQHLKKTHRDPYPND
jgi:hypothetical protein